jgi:hypothetical protein
MRSKQANSITILFALLLVVLALTQCTPDQANPGPTPVGTAPIGGTVTPVGPVTIENITFGEDRTANNDITQEMTFDQCSSATPGDTQVGFNQSRSEQKSNELVLSASVGGQIGSPIANASLNAAVEDHIKSTVTTTNSDTQSVPIQVPPHTKQQVTIVWREIINQGVVTYEEGKVPKAANYSKRGPIKFYSRSTKDIPCPEVSAPAPRVQELAKVVTVEVTRPVEVTREVRVPITREVTVAVPIETVRTVVVTATPSPAPSGGVAGSPITPSPEPAATHIADVTPPASILSMGESWRKNGLELKMADGQYFGQSTYYPHGCYAVNMKMKNGSAQPVYLTFDTEQFWITDNNGRRYPMDDKFHSDMGCTFTGYDLPIDIAINPGENFEYNWLEGGWVMQFLVPVTDPTITSLVLHAALPVFDAEAQWQIKIR